MWPQLLVIFCVLCLIRQASAQPRAPDRPQPSLVHGWVHRFTQQKQILAAKPAEICFVGDSLTEYWETTGNAIWELEFHELRAVNFGIAADRTENILYRLAHSNLAANPPMLFVVLAGTNNLSNEPPDSPEATVAAIGSVVALISKQCPKSTIFVLTLPPNGFDPSSKLRTTLVETNRRLLEFHFPESVEVVDIYPVFADDSHQWKREMTLDGTHFSQRGYDYLARILKPKITAALAKTQQ